MGVPPDYFDQNWERGIYWSPARLSTGRKTGPLRT
jgi:hypothetical protein